MDLRRLLMRRPAALRGFAGCAPSFLAAHTKLQAATQTRKKKECKEMSQPFVKPRRTLLPFYIEHVLPATPSSRNKPTHPQLSMLTYVRNDGDIADVLWLHGDGWMSAVTAVRINRIRSC